MMKNKTESNGPDDPLPFFIRRSWFLIRNDPETFQEPAAGKSPEKRQKRR